MYYRNLDERSTGQGAAVPLWQKHWAAVIKYLELDIDEGLPAAFIYEANKNLDGMIVARFVPFVPKFESKPGAVLDQIGELVVGKETAEAFCETFNSRKKRYLVLTYNSQVNTKKGKSSLCEFLKAVET